VEVIEAVATPKSERISMKINVSKQAFNRFFTRLGIQPYHLLNKLEAKSIVQELLTELLGPADYSSQFATATKSFSPD
jgi:hypothetical protein